jgi:cbb3-type cytochrome oxidase maturation protein
MDILYLLIPLSLVLVFLIGWVFWWSLSNDQFEDLDSPGHAILMDDDRAAGPASRATSAAARPQPADTPPPSAG